MTALSSIPSPENKLFSFHHSGIKRNGEQQNPTVQYWTMHGVGTSTQRAMSQKLAKVGPCCMLAVCIQHEDKTPIYRWKPLRFFYGNSI